MSCTLGSRESLEGGVTNGEITLEAWKRSKQSQCKDRNKNKNKKGSETIKSVHPDLSKKNTWENTHHELDVVKSIGQQVVLVLDQADGVEPLAHGLQRAAGTYEGVEGQTLQ